MTVRTTIVELTDGNAAGTRIGQSATEKLGFYGLETPIVQPSGTFATVATTAATTVATTAASTVATTAATTVATTAASTMATTAATSSSPFGFAEAQANAVITAVNGHAAQIDLLIAANNTNAAGKDTVVTALNADAAIIDLLRAANNTNATKIDNTTLEANEARGTLVELGLHAGA